VVEEFAYGVLHLESEGWRTPQMPIVNPGRLTREYIGVRRARYVAPLHGGGRPLRGNGGGDPAKAILAPGSR